MNNSPHPGSVVAPAAAPRDTAPLPTVDNVTALILQLQAGGATVSVLRKGKRGKVIYSQMTGTQECYVRIKETSIRS